MNISLHEIYDGKKMKKYLFILALALNPAIALAQNNPPKIPSAPEGGQQVAVMAQAPDGSWHHAQCQDFHRNPNGSWSPNISARIGNAVFEANTAFSSSVSIGGVNLAAVLEKKCS
ncbi:hypothetical protein [Gluconobacter japonicus]|uniref:hypothetical protein n=1 Tax=Gluconobacter japonicus TaxID=376620 RepID=UPI000A8C1899|nr:hypothetical protein [Gluconobacter japonicus]